MGLDMKQAMIEPNEPTGLPDEVEVFRTSSQGGLELRHQPESPFVMIRSNGKLFGHDLGVPFDADSLERLAKYLSRYALRLSRVVPGYMPIGGWQDLATAYKKASKTE